MNEEQEKQLNKLKTKLGKIDRIRTENQKIQVLFCKVLESKLGDNISGCQSSCRSKKKHREI